MEPYKIFAVAVFVVCAVAGQAEAMQVYFNDFESSVGSEWTNTSTDITPFGSREFLGQFCNDTVSLILCDLPAHTSVTISFDLFIIRSWDGNSAYYVEGIGSHGPDIWSLQVDGGQYLLYTTFCNYAPSESHQHAVEAGQAYPGTFPDDKYYPNTGASEINSLGFTYPTNPYTGVWDSVYNLNFTFEHSTPDLQFNFSASGLYDYYDESWGLDNVRVNITPTENIIPEPGTMILLATGALGVAGVIRKRLR